MPSNAHNSHSDDVAGETINDGGLEGFNLFDPEVQQCPHAYYAEMQKESGVFETDVFGTPIYLVTRYEDVAACAMNPKHFLLVLMPEAWKVTPNTGEGLKSCTTLKAAMSASGQC